MRLGGLEILHPTDRKGSAHLATGCESGCGHGESAHDSHEDDGETATHCEPPEVGAPVPTRLWKRAVSQMSQRMSGLTPTLRHEA
jgi:hypothetical protein